MYKPLLKICAIGAIAGISGVLPIPAILKAVIVVGAFIGLLLVKTEEDEE